MEEDVRSDLQVGTLCIVALLGIGSNGFIFLLFHHRKSVRTFSNRFVLSLALCHILQCFLLIPSFVASIRKWSFGETWMKTNGSITVCINLATVLSILLIAFDRNCAVNSPLHYTVTITKKRAGFLISFVWFVSILLAVPTLFGVPQLEDSNNELTSASWDFERVTAMTYIVTLSLIGFVVPLISVTFLYFVMFRAAESNNARARRSSSNSCISNEVVVNLKPPKNFGENEYSLRRNFSSDHTESNGGYCCFAGQHKAAITGLIVVATFVTCWSPYFLTLVYQQFREVELEIKFWVQLATYLSCILNPYVYFYRNKNTWKQTKKLISRMFRRKSSDFIAHPIARKNRIDTSKCLLRLPTSFSHTVLPTQAPLKNCFSHNSIPEDRAHKHIVLGQEISASKKIGVFSVDPIKSLVHQDSSSSNDSSDACVTTVMMGSCLSIDVDSPLWYQSFHQRIGGVSMTESPLKDVVTI